MTEKSNKSWKTPNEIIRLQRLKQRQKALQPRCDRPSMNNVDKRGFNVVTEKRKNPFLDRRESISSKKAKATEPETNDFISEDSIFNLLASASTTVSVNNTKIPLQSNNQKPVERTDILSFASLINEGEANDADTEDGTISTATSHVPIDWSLKTKLRISVYGDAVIPVSNLKSNEEASGVTGFVRCMDLKSSTASVDISPAALFSQSTMYWQHPHIPWLTLFPRMSKANNSLTIGEAECAALANDWKASFRALYFLVRALQCPYFYVCANSFNVLFRAAGIGGRVEIHAFLTPTTRGLRAALKQAGIEFTMPLKHVTDKENPNGSFDSGNETQSNSFTNFPDENKLDNSKESIDGGNNDEGVANYDSDDQDEEQWLASLGVEQSEIKKMSTKHARRVHNDECAEDKTDQSLVLVEGVECQTLFDFLLNAKSTTTTVGRLAGIPPTLIAPVAFPGATLRKLQVQSSTKRMNNIVYRSMELKGVILPHILHYLCNLLRETEDKFSATMVNFPETVTLSTAAQKLIDNLSKDNRDAISGNVFGRENLSDCGMQPKILEDLCRISPDSVRTLERMCFDKKQGGYTWA